MSQATQGAPAPKPPTHGGRRHAGARARDP